MGLAVAASAQLLGATVVIVGDLNAERLAQARSFGCETVDVGFEAGAHGKDAPEAPATVRNSLMGITRAGCALRVPGLYVTDDPGGVDEDARSGTLKVRLGLGWAKSHRFTTGA